MGAGKGHVCNKRICARDLQLRIAPAEVKDYLRHYYMRYSGPAGMTEQDDMENWLYATAASTGTVARRYPFNYQQSMGKFTTDHPLGGEVSVQVTEQIARGFYRRWTSYMQGGDWNELLGAPAGNRQAAE